MSEMSVKTIGTHNGTFHADDCLAVYMLRLLPEFKNSKIIRSRNSNVLETCDIIVDVHGKYDGVKYFDHHQRYFNETFSENFKTKLSSSGLIFKFSIFSVIFYLRPGSRHFGKKIISHRLELPINHPHVDILYVKLYESFLEAIDAGDNGISAYPSDTKPFQFLIVPSLMIYFLDTLSEQSTHSWITRFLTNIWLGLLTRSTPVFTLLEGFTSLLVIQALGQFVKWLVNNCSDSWMILLLSTSGGILSASFYFLYQIYTTLIVTVQNATLIGILLTCAVFISTYGIHTGRGNVAEGSLLFAYLVYSIYMICSDLQASGDILKERNLNRDESVLPFPSIIMESYTTIVSSIAFRIPKALWRMAAFLKAIASTITPSIITSLVYRLSVLYAATRIVPVVRNVSRGVEHIPSLDDDEPTSRIMSFVHEEMIGIE
ncbi:hypothetical protein PCK2_000648 [Pneumocystis canis]|nr:hypothetical protein PCK2_000648 [Pneumocystis canis]